jgi:hypothetical protein
VHTGSSSNNDIDKPKEHQTRGRTHAKRGI